MNNNDDFAKSTSDYIKIKSKHKFQKEAYKITRGSINSINEKRKVRVHRRSIEAVHQIDPEINSFNKKSKFEDEGYSNLDQNIQQNYNKINSIDLQREALISERQKYLNKNTMLKTSLGYLNENTFNTDTKDKNFYENNTSTKQAKQKKINRKKMSENIGFEKDKQKISFEDTKDFKSSSKSENQNKTSSFKTENQKRINQKKMQSGFGFENEREKQLSRSFLSNPLTSSEVGKRTLTQKAITSPLKVTATLGGSLKEGINKEINESDMAGIQLANDIVSPLARKIQFEGSSLIAKKVGFDRKAYNLNKIEKNIIKVDKKASTIKKAQRKNIRKKAKINAKTVKGSNMTLMARAKNSAYNLKKQLLDKISKMVTSLKGVNGIIIASFLALVILIPMFIVYPVFAIGGSALTVFHSQEANLSDDDLIFEGDFDIEGGKLTYPVPNFQGISSPFGWRIHPIFGTKKLHTGTDFPAPTGTPVIAVADGKVIESGSKGGYGKTIMIDHGSGVITLYAHNSSLEVEVGQVVQVGQVIAKVGSTGNSTGPHSHFEVRKNGEYTDPMNWIR